MNQFWVQASPFIFITLMKCITGFVKKLNIIMIYNHIIEDIIVPPTSEKYSDNVLGLRDIEYFLYKSYVCGVNILKDKKLAETKF